jgi:N4-(beta-N-acetylglucosaminyl)-L-asparaginase
MIWLRRKELLSESDYWYPPKSEELDEEIRQVVGAHGTIYCCTLNDAGDLAGVTTTSGFFFKIPGRVGDSPIVGAGLYVDHDIGAAGSTGLGEANILTCGLNMVVEFMRDGYSPEEAGLRGLKRIAEKARFWPDRLDEQGRPRFQLNFYAVNKEEKYAGAAMWEGGQFAVHDGANNRIMKSAYLFEQVS